MSSIEECKWIVRDHPKGAIVLAVSPGIMAQKVEVVVSMKRIGCAKMYLN